MPIPDASVADLHNVVEAALKTIIQAESSITDLLGISTKERNQKTVEVSLRDDVRDVADSELPAVFIQVDSGQDEDAEADGALNEIVHDMPVRLFVLARGGNKAEVDNRCQKVSTTVMAFLRKQLNSSSELNAALGSTDTIIKNVAVTYGDAQAQQVWEVIGEITFNVRLDICIPNP